MITYYIAGFPITDELYHHGIKGQKWGIRRYQNEDGTLTPAGKARYGTPIERQAARDAQRLSDARASYDSGSATRKLLVNEEIENRKKSNKEYAKALKEAQKHSDMQKSFKRAESLKKNEATFNSGRQLSKHGKTVSNTLLKSLGTTALVGTDFAIAASFTKGIPIVNTAFKVAGAVDMAYVMSKGLSDAYKINYYERNRKF